MAIMTDNATRTARLLALMTKGDDAFNARDFAAVDTIHHPKMVAHITGNAQAGGRDANYLSVQVSYGW